MKKQFFQKVKRQIIESFKLAALGCLENSFFPSGVHLRMDQDGKHHLVPPRPSGGHGHPVHHWGRALLWVGALLSTLALSGISAWGQDTLAPEQKWIESADAGFVLPASQNAAGFLNPGYGGDILVGYRFNRNFSLSTDLGYYDCDQKGPAGSVGGEWIYVPLMEIARYNFGSGWVRPFVLLGMGVAFNNYSETLLVSGLSQKVTRQETDFLMAPGAGVLFVVNPRFALYIQGRVDMNFVSNRTLIGPFIDNPSVFIPLKAGISFFVL